MLDQCKNRFSQYSSLYSYKKKRNPSERPCQYKVHSSILKIFLSKIFSQEYLFLKYLNNREQSLSSFINIIQYIQIKFSSFFFITCTMYTGSCFSRSTCFLKLEKQQNKDFCLWCRVTEFIKTICHIHQKNQHI